MQIIEVLIVDDHHLMVEGYKSILAYFNDFELNISAIYNSEDCIKIISSPTARTYDIIILDLSLPPYKLAGISGGIDIAIIFKRQFPNTKIAIITSHAEAFILYDIAKKIQPQGLMVKSDFTAEDFLKAFKIILEGGCYYSKAVQEYLKKIGESDNYIDSYNRQIISFLAQGIQSKNLPKYLPLSMSAIDKRKVQIKDFFNLENGNDEDIIRQARLLGYI